MRCLSSAVRNRPWVLIGICLALMSVPSGPMAQDGPPAEQHFAVDMPADLSPKEAEATYQGVLDDMVRAYALSQDPAASAYRRWQRYNGAPYPSAPHGTRYVNVYGNMLAEEYGRGKPPLAMPEGAVLVKDAFAVTSDGDVFLGPLFVMEKMAPGFDAESRDWRYSMIMPDGSFFGMIGGDNDRRVRFCVTCHRTAGEATDHLFFVPERFRIGD